jgi:electron transport complex protein RnfB
MAYFITEACIGCTICETKCPTDTIVGAKKETFHIIEEGCIDCGTCGIWCPVDAIEDSNGNLVKGLKPKDVPKAKVDLDGCTSCEYCVDACPFDCITMAPHPDGQFSEIAVVDEKKCVGCRLCEESCLWEAIYMDGDRMSSLSQNPIKDSFVDKIMPQASQINDRDEDGFIKKSISPKNTERDGPAERPLY